MQSLLSQAKQTEAVTVSPGALSIAEVVAVARFGARVELADEALTAAATARARVEELADQPRPVYGVSTGFGALAKRHIPAERRALLQKSLIRSHAAGTGAPVEREVVRALMLLRLSTLATGHTGVRPEVLEAYRDLINSGYTPVVPEYGSLGCSGDLAPLAHCALALLGEGSATDPEGRVVPVAEALERAGIEPLELKEKEGLALINGTDGMTGQLCLALADLEGLARCADIATGLSLEGLKGTPEVFADSHVQDAYSIRCAPQVAGAFRDTLDHAAAVCSRELASAIDNPVVADDGRVTSNGNFHGAPVAYVLDFLAIAAADLASISERRTDRFLDTARSRGLPAFLADDPGVDSGHMIAQYSQAGIVSELKRLAAPSSVDSIPSSAMQEDHVSMGWGAARKLRRSVDGLGRVLAIELLTAARAVELRDSKPAAGTGAAIAALREEGAAGPGPDRFLAPEIDAAVRAVVSGRLAAAVDRALGE
ncbi:histidine ammonia-lyase [Corynebacterium otitidis]